MFTKKVFLFILVTLALVIPLTSFAATVSGTIQGFNCVSRGTTCPADKLDPHLAFENKFVLLTSKGYYVLPNVSMNVLAKYATLNAKVTGEVNKKYNSIKANSVEVMVNGKYKVVWSQAMLDAAYKELVKP